MLLVPFFADLLNGVQHVLSSQNMEDVLLRVHLPHLLHPGRSLLQLGHQLGSSTELEQDINSNGR